jgi:serine/threonine-protein kinase
LHFLYGCWLYVVEGKDIADIHFLSPIDALFPRSWNLFSYYYTGKIAEGTKWWEKAFLWEKRQLYRQQALFYRCSGQEGKAQACRQKVVMSYEWSN